ncbi:MAG: ATP-binding protein [Ruminococcus flavefaciens]|nr:ATP-binding protein [Ruminococcus flavefaciens]
MILSIRVDNFLVYSNEVELSLTADMRIKKFADNVYFKKGLGALKSVCIYGPNNSGKTCLIRAINSIKNVLSSIVAEVPYNLFRKDKVCSFGVTFISDERVFSYDFKYDSTIVNGYKKGFIYECFKELIVDKYKNISEQELFVRDVINGKYYFKGNEELSRVLSLVSNDNILIYTINSIKYPEIEEYKNILRNFANNIEILDMNNIPMAKTINVLKNNEDIKEKTVELIKLSDLDIEDYLYYKDGFKTTVKGISNEQEIPNPREMVLKTNVSIDDMFRLTSIHKGKPVQSFSFDSTGTKKIVAISSYIVDAIKNGKTLVVDELDSSLHFKLTRAIVSLFNNELNVNAQIIFTAHDATLLDCKKLFRKDQIWFATKDLTHEYLYSLADFTAKEDKIRSETDLFDKYNLGVFGAIPEPDMISILIADRNCKGDN